MLYSLHNLQVGVLPILLLSGAFAVFEPIKIGPMWLQSPIMIFSFVVLIPGAVIAFISPNSIVGERINKTLEPLLATPVSNRSILFGKISAAVAYGWGIALINMSLGLVVINFSFAGGGVLLYPINIFIPIILLSLLCSILVAILGINFSLFATTLLEAQNKLGAAIIVPLVIPAFMAGPFMPKTWAAMAAQTISFYGVTNMIVILILILLLVDSILLVVVLTRFRRKQLLF